MSDERPHAIPDHIGLPPARDLVVKWRNLVRERLLEQRRKQDRRECGACAATIRALLSRAALVPADCHLGIYWPQAGEIDIRPFARWLQAQGGVTALPVAIAKNRPLEFWQWDAGDRLCSRGLWSIPAPANRRLMIPTMLLVPMLGFDESGHRLGYGGGYYDRTLAAMKPRPLTIGIGCEYGRLPTIYPQDHDIPMDVIVTESGISFRSRA